MKKNDIKKIDFRAQDPLKVDLTNCPRTYTVTRDVKIYNKFIYECTKI